MEPMPKLRNYSEKSLKIFKKLLRRIQQQTIRKVLRSYTRRFVRGEPLSVDSAESLINSMFFDARRYDLAKVGRYKFNKKLMFRNRIAGHRLAQDVLDPSTGRDHF